MFAKVSPVAVFPSEATQLRCLEVLVRGLGSNASSLATYALCDDQGVKLQQSLMEMPFEVFRAWGPDDTFVLQWLATTMGLTILDYEDDVPEPTPEPTPEPDPDPVPPVDPTEEPVAP